MITEYICKPKAEKSCCNKPKVWLKGDMQRYISLCSVMYFTFCLYKVNPEHLCESVPSYHAPVNLL